MQKLMNDLIEVLKTTSTYTLNEGDDNSFSLLKK